MGTLSTRLGRRFLRFRGEFLVMAHALRHPDTPVRLKLAGGAVLLYLLSPLDLVPITIPFLGVLDDALLVPWGVGQVVKALPPGARTDAEAGAARFVSRWVKRPLLAFVVVLAGLLTVWMTLLWLFWRFVLS
jgi:uncharacterized membrane protein YkvA (DUF1232 family)